MPRLEDTARLQQSQATIEKKTKQQQQKAASITQDHSGTEFSLIDANEALNRPSSFNRSSQVAASGAAPKQTIGSGGGGGGGGARSETVSSKVSSSYQELVRTTTTTTTRGAVKAATSGEVNNNETISTKGNQQQQQQQQLLSNTVLQQYRSPLLFAQSQLPGLKMDNTRGQYQNGKSPSSASPQLDNTRQQLTQQLQPSQTGSIPSYNSIFNSNQSNQQTNKTQQQQQITATTNLDEELFGNRLSTVPAPGQKQTWSNLSTTTTTTTTTSALQTPGSRAPLKKQQPHVNAPANDSLSSSKKLLVFNYEAPTTRSTQQQQQYGSNHHHHYHQSDEKEKQSYTASEHSVSCSDDDDDESHIDEEESLNQQEVEFLPFNNNHHHNGNSQKRSNGDQQRSSRQQVVTTKKQTFMNKSAPPARPNSKTRSSSNSRGAPDGLKRADSVQRKQQQLDKDNGKNSTKISMINDQLVQQAAICQQYAQQKYDSCKKLDLLEQAAYLNCECSACAKKRKLVGFVQGQGAGPGLAAPSYYHHPAQQLHHLTLGEKSTSALLIEKRYPKTRVMHMILKSIILVLCTLLLLTLLVGTAVLTTILPQVVDKITNVSRSFNVTIAGR